MRSVAVWSPLFVVAVLVADSAQDICALRRTQLIERVNHICTSYKAFAPCFADSPYTNLNKDSRAYLLRTYNDQPAERKELFEDFCCLNSTMKCWDSCYGNEYYNLYPPFKAYTNDRC